MKVHVLKTLQELNNFMDVANPFMEEFYLLLQ